jgi:FkbM family methyltransferase
MIKNKSLRDISDAMQQRFKPHEPLVCVDIGAYIGKVALSISELYKNARTYAIEPCPANYAVLVQHTQHNPNIVPVCTAISDRNGCVDLSVMNSVKCRERHGGDVSSESNSLYGTFTEEYHKRHQTSIESRYSISVGSRTLDRFMDDHGIGHIDLLSVNCEGGEYKIFDSGAMEFLNRTELMLVTFHGKRLPFTSVEFADKRAKIFNTLRSRNFKLLNKVSDNYRRHRNLVFGKRDETEAC